MRYSLVCIGSTGDVRPYMLLGRELKVRGHDVSLCAFEDFREMIEAEGMRFMPLSGDVRALMSNVMKPGGNGISFLNQVRVSLAHMKWPFLAQLEAACDGAEVIVSTYFGQIVQSIAEMHSVPFIQTHYYPMDVNDTTPISAAPGQRAGKAWNRISYPLAYLIISAMELLYVSDWRKAHGMRPRKLSARPDYLINGHRVPVLYAMSPLLMSRPPTWGEHIHMTGFWLNDEKREFTPDPMLEDFLARGSKPIYIGFGSMTSGDMGETLEIVLEAIAGSGVRAVLATGWGEVELPKHEGIFPVDYVPHGWLFERVAAVVHHGGAGTTASGVLAGKPTLVIPFGGDQPFWAMRVRMLGLGPTPIRREKLTVAKLTKALRNLISVKSYAVAARELGQRMRMENGVANAADIIEHEVRKWHR